MISTPTYSNYLAKASFFVGIFFLIATTYADAKAARDYKQDILGTWTLSAYESLDDVHEKFSITFLTNTKLSWESGKDTISGKYAISTHGGVSRISVLYEDEDIPWNGLMKLQEGELWICFADAGSPPPDTFELKSGRTLLKFIRGK